MVGEDRWDRVDRLFDAALDLDGEERDAFLERECAGDGELRVHVERLLGHAHSKETPFDPGGGLPSVALANALESEQNLAREGTTFDAYRLIRPLGEGGMGVVWHAEQTEPVRRSVAIKILRPGMQSGPVLERFEAERQSLARMTHPNIAQVFDAGTTGHGGPYFAMELVEGPAVTEYCDKRRLTPRRRIKLFLQVCRGVQHAHQKGVIHRDLKPSNVLVAEHNGVGTPKIIDFGIAKAIGPEGERALETRAGHPLGTPAYMSPEQARSDASGIDIRSDVYSLGMLLYELLVGVLPADLDELADLAARRSLDELQVPRPSVRLTGLAGEGPRFAGCRGTTMEALGHALRGDLDWVVLKAMEREPDRRYSSVDGLVADLERYLAHEPVEARPPSVLYQGSKFVRRHRVAVLAASAVSIALLAGAALATYGMLRARAAEAAALKDAETARQITDFMVDVFRVNNPEESLGRTVTARELLDRSADQIRFELADQPAVHAELMSAIGRAYLVLGIPERADPLLASAYEEHSLSSGESDIAVAESLEDLGELRLHQGRYDEAIELLGRALGAKESILGPDHAEIAHAAMLLSAVHVRMADYDQARALAERSLAIRRRGASDRDVAESLRQLGVLEVYENRMEEGIALYEEAYETASRGLGDDHPFTLDLLDSKALAMQSMGDEQLESSIELMRSVLESRRRVFSEDHPTTAFSYHNLGRSLAAAGRHDESIPLYEKAIAIRERALGEQHPYVGFTLESLAIARAVTGDLAAAEVHFTRALAISEVSLGETHPETLETLQNLAILAMYQADRERALAHLEEAVRRGFEYLDIMLEPPLDELVGEPRYDAAIDRVRARIAMHEEGGEGARQE